MNGAALSTIGLANVLVLENTAKVVVKIAHYITLHHSAIKDEKITRAPAVTKEETAGK